MLQSATYHLERQRTEDHGDEDVAAPSEETDAANHHYGDGRKFHAFADLRGVDRNLHSVDHARQGCQEAREDEGREYPSIDRDSDPTCDLLVVADRRDLTAEIRPTVD